MIHKNLQGYCWDFSRAPTTPSKIYGVIFERLFDVPRDARFSALAR